jgi:hypothetical protein
VSDSLLCTFPGPERRCCCTVAERITNNWRFQSEYNEQRESQFCCLADPRFSSRSIAELSPRLALTMSWLLARQ